MKKFILIGLLILPMLGPAPCSAAESGNTNQLVTAVDLLKLKGLAPFAPGCVIGTNQSGLVTAEDMLREKGLLGSPSGGDINVPEEDDIWGMDQDFGC